MENINNSLEQLICIMERLFDQNNGCAWVQNQTFESLMPYTIEEANEVINAIKNNDINNLKEELGDLLLQILFYSFIAQKECKFTFNEVVNNISEKLIRRSAHIFDDEISEQYQQCSDKIVFAVEQWKKAKKQESSN